jgi:hypothetical protein
MHTSVLTFAMHNQLLPLLLLLLWPGALEDAIIDVDVPNSRNTGDPGGLTIQVCFWGWAILLYGIVKH